MIFAAGHEKWADFNADIGVHGASEAGKETPGANAATVQMARFVKELGVPPAIIGRMVVTPPDDMVWLSPNDLRSMGVVMQGVPRQTPPNLTRPAQAAPSQSR